MVYEGAARWNIKTPDAVLVQRIMDLTGVPKVAASAMANRGVTPDNALAYVGPGSNDLPDPFLMKNMDVAAVHFADAIVAGEKIGVYSDYDSDGLCGAALLCWFAKMLGIELSVKIPSRHTEGYGLSIDGLRQLHESGTTLVISVDCGITAVAEAEFCKQIALKLLISDHHSPGEVIPDAVAVINPLLPGDQFPYKKLAGVGVAYNLVVATTKVLRDQGWFSNLRPEPVVECLLPLVAIGTVADVVELQEVNRTMVAQGICRIREGRHPFEGIRALCEASGVSETELTSGQIGWRLGPRLNCCGRLQTAQASLDLLLCENYGEALSIARMLDGLNTERQEIEASILESAIEMVEKKYSLKDQKTIVLAKEGWAPGVIGIVASRIVEKYNRPAVLISLDGNIGKGSCRSIEAFNMHMGLCACSKHLVKFGGHPMAAGLTINADQLRDFEQAFEVSASGLASEDLRPVIKLDAEIEAGDLTLQACEQMARLEPFGMGNSRPLFCLTRCKIEDVRVLKGKHLKLLVTKGGKKFDAIGFNMATVPLNDVIDIAFSPEKNEWMGKVSLQLQIKGLR
ncbi:single-stranded-DNA-specific exonuclease RecJ (plasmid) [Trichlorobacter lovleyi]|uniref:single-stranded-DNA-specific exonuclease RecJ n=1 Tax=Trichlorobacter lovleyi TaxID=313985 RepID=UPI00223EC544|nr:single-stranded-DNA-specific exonuclease RecJ [Trichlorobacter lovleyi]QOX80824.1 single-stranded-DNA-specific exonuclease RecJ [Trichlorobacter lovleyi]